MLFIERELFRQLELSGRELVGVDVLESEGQDALHETVRTIDISLRSRCPGSASHHAAASLRSHACLTTVIASSGCPHAMLDRVLTSTKTVSIPSRATRSISPCGQRQLRSSRSPVDRPSCAHTYFDPAVNRVANVEGCAYRGRHELIDYAMRTFWA